MAKEWSFLKMSYTFFFFNSYSKFTELFCDTRIYFFFKFIFLQGKGDILSMRENICLLKEFLLWREHLENGCLEMFPTLYDFVVENDMPQPQKS